MSEQLLQLRVIYITFTVKREDQWTSFLKSFVTTQNQTQIYFLQNRRSTTKIAVSRQFKAALGSVDFEFPTFEFATLNCRRTKNSIFQARHK